ncbi:hypothetical protein SAMN05216559_3441 [Halomicrobium zhouii]|uniref:Uncharacterized protein n=1 Tax=Halomicrobium zhouii TaxID=767519 RepID=A0A1I6LYP2_9EURY|nr:hypothetical protein [Halomicrobium zhouii]SFS08494.1 hypothetical protein SAMN05216559_3441 [Halomicrobium zhouii]
MVGTVALGTVAVSLVFFGGFTAVLVAVFRTLERDRYRTTGRRKLARSSFGFGAVASFTTLVALSTTFVLDIRSVFGFDAMLAGVGAVTVAAVPLTLGLVLALDGEKFDWY